MLHCFRLTRDADLLDGIDAFVRLHHIRAGAVLSAVGCVLSWRLRDAGGVQIQSGDDHGEIVSLTGTVSDADSHLHASFSRGDLSVFGGHLVSGCIVNTTAEIILLEIENTVFLRQPDAQTGYDELVIQKQ